MGGLWWTYRSEGPKKSVSTLCQKKILLSNNFCRIEQNVKAKWLRGDAAIKHKRVCPGIHNVRGGDILSSNSDDFGVASEGERHILISVATFEDASNVFCAFSIYKVGA